MTVSTLLQGTIVPQPFRLLLPLETENMNCGRAIESCLAQTGDCYDVWLYDDDSTDGTTEDVLARFPEVNVIRCRSRRGLIVRRNEALCHVPGRLIISLDDDAYFTSRETVLRVIELFEEFPQAAVIALFQIAAFQQYTEFIATETGKGVAPANF